jgi:3-oxoacyl-[acyl-carrier protein] reductase
MPTTFDFTGRSVIVTGAARGIGLDVGRMFHEAGAATYLVDFDAEELDRAVTALGCSGVAADVSATADVERVVETVVAETGRVDVLVNNAGILIDKMTWKLTDDDWDRVLATHAGGTFRFTRACIPHFRARGYGRIINVTSYTGLHGNLGQANYATAKAGIIGFTKSVAKETGRFGITVNAISPNALTRMVESIPADKLEEVTQAIPMGRWGDPAEIAYAVGFLASEEASYITGAVLPVDGGLAM